MKKSEAAALRLMAHIQDVVADRRREAGLPFDDCTTAARQYRTQADLIEQGVPVEVARRALSSI